MDELQIVSVGKLDIKPGDRVIIKLAGPIDAEGLDTIIERAREALKIGDGVILAITADNVDITTEYDAAAACERIRQLHIADRERQWCDADGFAFPCPTLRILDGETP
jgi:hypothetical protein